MKHRGEYKFKCSICSKGFYEKAHFQGHLNSHGNLHPNWCPKCGKQFLYSQDIGKHLDKCGVSEKNFECEIGSCKGTKFFTTQQLLVNHQKGYHKMGDGYVCDKCSFQTFYVQTYEKHMNSHK